MKLDDVSPHCVFLSRAARTDRRATLLPQLAAIGIFNAQWLRAIEVPTLRNDARGFFTLPKRSCAIGKRLAMRLAGRRNLLFFEDDVVLHEDFTAKLAALTLPEDWQIFYLGCMHVERPVPVSTGVVRVERAFSAHAMLVRGDFLLTARRAMRGGGKGAKGELHSDVLLSDLHKAVPTYAAFPNLAWQRGDFSDLAGTNYQAYGQNGEQLFYREAIGQEEAA